MIQQPQSVFLEMQSVCICVCICVCSCVSVVILLTSNRFRLSIHTPWLVQMQIWPLFQWCLPLLTLNLTSCFYQFLFFLSQYICLHFYFPIPPLFANFSSHLFFLFCPPLILSDMLSSGFFQSYSQSSLSHLLSLSRTPAIQDQSKKISTYQLLLNRLPRVNKATLQALINHLYWWETQILKSSCISLCMLLPLCDFSPFVLACSVFLRWTKWTSITWP